MENTQKIDMVNGGCDFRATFRVNKVPGNFHVSTHGAAEQPDNPDMTHMVDGLMFGEDSTVSGYFSLLPRYILDSIFCFVSGCSFVNDNLNV